MHTLHRFGTLSYKNSFPGVFLDSEKKISFGRFVGLWKLAWKRILSRGGCPLD